MHLPGGSLDNLTCTVTTILAAGATAYAWRRVQRTPESWNPGKLGAAAAFVFAVQMVNYPVAAGVSGHMVGGVLAGAILGPWLGLLAMVLVLSAQCLLAGDGGLTTLGANILTMGVVATWGGALVRRLMSPRVGSSFATQTVVSATAAWVSIVAASAACALIWTSGSSTTLAEVLGPMLAIHARIGVGEATITSIVLAAMQLWAANTAKTEPRRGIAMTLAAAVAIAALLAPWASPSPDGLEHVASAWTAWPQGTFAFVPTPDYALPGIQNELLATALAGAIGALAIFAATNLAGKAVGFTLRRA